MPEELAENMENMENEERILAEVTPSISRRAIAVFMLLALGGVLIYVTFSTPPQSLIWRSVFVVAGIGALVVADTLRRATAFRIIMTHDEIRDTQGRVLCRMDDITAVEKSAFAFKPSNGFLLVTKQPQSRVWAPGLWWRFGRKVGVGGVTSAAQGKYMADLVSLKLRGDLEKLHPRDGDYTFPLSPPSS